MNKFKKFLITGAAVITMVASLSGCTYTPPEEQSQQKEEEVLRFKEVYRQDEGINGTVLIYVDTETGVMYMTHDISYGGGLTVMVDENGKPLIWEGEDGEG